MIFLCVVVVLTICHCAGTQSTNTEGNARYINNTDDDSVGYEMIESYNSKYNTTKTSYIFKIILNYFYQFYNFQKNCAHLKIYLDAQFNLEKYTYMQHFNLEYIFSCISFVSTRIYYHFS